MLKKIMAIMLSFCTILYAENIVVDAGRNKNLHVDKAANGVTLVNIETPDGKGLSHNVFTEYNVDQKGVLLNNALEVEKSQLGGLIYGNPNLQNDKKQASTILNEVSGVNPSKLEGFTEIVGKQADYILANPNGIYVNGAGFINTGNVKLTTGDAGHLQNPEKGQIEIAGKGLDVRNISKSELIARTALFTAPIYGGEEVNIQVGSRGQKNKPEFALDARNLGSIYAGKIKIISNEEGVGVKSAGRMYASKGDILLDSKGNAYVGEAHAKKDIRIHSKETEIAKNAVAENRIEIQSETLRNQGKIAANQGIILKGDVENRGILLSNADITIESKNITNREKILAKRNLEMRSTSIVNEGKLQANGAIHIETENFQNQSMLAKDISIRSRKIENKNQMLAKETLRIMGQDFKNEKSVYSGKSSKIQVDSIDNLGEFSSDGDMHIQANVIESQSILAKEKLQMGAKHLIVKEKLQSEQDMALASDYIENTGNIVSGNKLKVEAKTLKNTKNIVARQEVNIATKDLDNDSDKGMIYSEDRLGLKADTIELTKNISAKNTLSLEAKTLKRSETYITNSDMNLYVDGEYTNEHTLIGKDVTIIAKNFANNSIVASRGTLEVVGKEKSQNNKNSILYSGSDMKLSGGNFQNRGEVASKKDATLQFSGDVENLSADLLAEGSMSIQAKNFRNKGHLTGNYSRKWVEGYRSNIDVNKLPKEFLEEIDALLERNRQGRKFRGWSGERRLDGAEEGISHYVSHKSYVKAGKDLRLEVENEVLNQEADMLADGNIEIKADTLRNTREGKEINITLKFSKRYNYRYWKHGKNRTGHGDIDAYKSWKETLYSDKPTQIIAGGNISIQARQVGNGEEKSNTSSNTKTIASPVLESNVGKIDATFRVNNNSLVENIKKEAAIDVKDYIDIPMKKDGMFLLRKDKENPKFSYLIETNPKLIHREFYLGSEYFFSRIGFNPDRDIRLLGDSFYEQRLISKAVLEGTGKRYLYSKDVNVERKTLFDNAAEAQKDLHLSLGVSLSKEQINRLKQDIVWYVEEEVAGEKVLVPKIYLSKNTLKEIQDNPGTHVQAGGNVSIDALALDNNGTIRAKENVRIKAKDILQNAAYANTGIYGKNISLLAEENIENVGGNIQAEEDVLLFSKEGDVQNKKKLSIHENDLRNVFTGVRGSGEIQGKNVTMIANQVKNLGAEIRAEEKLEIGARENLEIGSLEAVDQKISISKKHFVKDRNTQNIGSHLEAKSIQLHSSGDIGVVGSNLLGKEEIMMKANKEIHIVSGKNTSLHEEKHRKSKGIRGSSEIVGIEYNTKNISSNLIGKDVIIESNKNISILGSNIQAGVDGKATITAKGDITQAGVKEIRYSYHEKTKTGLMGLTKKTKMNENYQEEAIKSATASGTRGVIYDSRNDLLLEGVNVVSTGTVQMKGKQIEIDPLESKEYSKVKTEKRGFASSFGKGSFSVSYGKDIFTLNRNKGIQNPSEITSAKDIHLEASDKVKIKSVEMYAKEEIRIQGDQGVEFTAAKNTSKTQSKRSSDRLGVSVGAKSELVNTLENAKNVKKLTDFSGNFYDVANTASKLVGAIKDGAAAMNTVTTERYGKQKNEKGTQSVENDNYRTISTDWKDYVSANVGLSKSKSESSHYQEEGVKNTIESGGNVAIVSKEGSVSLEGTNIHTAKNLRLLAKDKVEVKAASEENTSSSSSSQRGLSAGISASGQKGKREGTSYVNSRLHVGGDYKVLAKDIVHEGANVEANTIHMQGENIRISSIQDVSKQKDSSYGGSLSVNLTNPALSSGSRGKGEGAWVKAQSSLLTKEGGSIVGKNFENVGSIVGSHSEINKLQVQADRVHVGNLEDKNKYENKGGGISLSSSVPNISVQHDKVDKEQATRATAVNTDFVVVGEQKTSEELGFNTVLSKAQEVTKDEEKHLNAELHTDLLGKDKQEELARAGNVLKDIQKAIVNKDNTKGNFEERYRQGRIMRGIAEEIQKNPEWLSVFEVTPENTGKTAAEVERVRAAVYSQAMNGFLKAHGYQPQYDAQGKEINPITTIVTEIADPNTPMYMSESENKFVIDRKYLLSLSRDQAMNGIGHEFGHYSTQDEIATKDQSVANYTGSLLENHTKKIESKPISEATWNRLLNSSSVITGPGAEVIASGIAVDEREYYKSIVIEGEVAAKIGGAKGGYGIIYNKDQKTSKEEYGYIVLIEPQIGVTLFAKEVGIKTYSKEGEIKNFEGFFGTVKGFGGYGVIVGGKMEINGVNDVKWNVNTTAGIPTVGFLAGVGYRKVIPIKNPSPLVKDSIKKVLNHKEGVEEKASAVKTLWDIMTYSESFKKGGA